MALTRRGDGTGGANRVFAAWWNDFYDLLTGAMTDQPVTIASTTATRLTRVGSTSVETPLLSLKTTVSAAHEYDLRVDTGGNIKLYDVDNGGSVLLGNKNAVTLVPNGGNLAVSSTWATLKGSNMVVMRGFGGATAGKQIWVMTGATDPTAADGLVEGDLVFKY